MLIHTPSTAGNPVARDQYDVQIIVPAGSPNHSAWIIPALPVTESGLINQGISGLIGRDILNLGVLIYNGTIGHFTISY
jgi:hypothetical protein